MDQMVRYLLQKKLKTQKTFPFALATEQKMLYNKMYEIERTVEMSKFVKVGTLPLLISDS